MIPFLQNDRWWYHAGWEDAKSDNPSLTFGARPAWWPSASFRDAQANYISGYRDRMRFVAREAMHAQAPEGAIHA